jgi:hypothetical protein
MFEQLLPVFASLLITLFQGRKKLPASNWIRTHFKEISIYVEADSVNACVKALKEKTQPDDESVREVLSSGLGSVIFDCFKSNLLVADFVKSIDDRLDELENLDFAPAYIDSFKEVIGRDESAMIAGGFGNYTTVNKKEERSASS